MLSAASFLPSLTGAHVRREITSMSSTSTQDFAIEIVRSNLDKFFSLDEVHQERLEILPIQPYPWITFWGKKILFLDGGFRIVERIFKKRKKWFNELILFGWIFNRRLKLMVQLFC